MGDFRIVIESAGNHGCNRAVKEGEEFYGCGRMDCPDCVARRVVDSIIGPHANKRLKGQF